MIIIVFIILLVVYEIWEKTVRRIAEKAVGLHLGFSDSKAYAGDTISFCEVIENKSRLPVPVLEIGFRVERGVLFEDAENITESDYIYKRDVFSLLGRERITRNYRLKCQTRGEYRISQTSIRVRALPSHSQYVRSVPETDRLFVYARRVDVSEILRSLDTILGQRESARKVYEDPFAFSSIREYTIRDPMKTINWKASAKSGELMVNTFTSVQEERLAVYLDVEDGGIIKEADRVEECISMAATLCSRLLGKGLETSLHVGVRGEDGGCPAFGPGRGEKLLMEMEQYLTSDFTKCTAASVPELLDQAPPGSAIPVILTKNASPGLVRGIAKVCGRENYAVLVQVVGRGEPCPVHSDGCVRVIRREVTL